MFNKRKKVYFGLSLMVLLIAAIGMVIATGWDDSKPSHDTLYTDEIRGKSGDTVNVNDKLEVQNPVYGAAVAGLSINNDFYGYLGYEPSPGSGSGVYGASSSNTNVGELSTNDAGVEGSTSETGGNAVMGVCTGDNCKGVYGRAHKPGGSGVYGEAAQYGTEYADYGVYGIYNSNGNFGYLGGKDYAVYGSYGGGNIGYLGGIYAGAYGYSRDGFGVWAKTMGGDAVHAEATGDGYAVYGSYGGGHVGYLGGIYAGAYGYSSAGYGVWAKTMNGEAVHAEATGDGYAINAESSSGPAISAYSDKYYAGIISGCGSSDCYGLYTGNKVYAGEGVEVDASAQCKDSSTGTCSLNDIAEDIPAADDVEAGDVVIIDVNNPGRVIKSNKAYDTMVAGVISTSPAFHIKMEDSNTPLALAGRVPVKVSTENGAIKVGDLLTTSNTPGYAMKCTDMQRCALSLVGRAIEPLDSGKGKIIVLLD